MKSDANVNGPVRKIGFIDLMKIQDPQGKSRKPLRVLKKAGLRHETDADLHSDDAFVFMFFALFRFLTWRVRHSQPLFATRICFLFFVISKPLQD